MGSRRLLLLAGLAACAPSGSGPAAPPLFPTVDGDGDGWAPAAEATAGAADCDDEDPVVFPGAVEACNGEDDDCDGLVDEGFPDADDDGWPDCLDCDEGDAGVNPGANDLCNDGIDQDCDGRDLPCIADVAWVLVGEAAGDEAGSHVAPAGDVNGDGWPDLLVGAPYQSAAADNAGAAYLVLGPVTGDRDLSAADAILRGEGISDTASPVAGAGDVDGDGFDDVLIGAPYAGDGGAAYLVYGPVEGEVDLSLADAIMTGDERVAAGRAVAGPGDVDGDGFADLVVSTSGTGICVVRGPVEGVSALTDAWSTLSCGGTSLAAAGDVDGDGSGDLLVGAPGSERGNAYVVTEFIEGVTGVTGRLYGEDAGDEAGTSVAGAGDVNGDGFADVLVGAPGHGGTGAAYLVLGPIEDGWDLAVVDARFTGDEEEARAGTSVAGAGDVDGDGFDDLLVGAPGDSQGDQGSGAIYRIHGPITGQHALAEVGRKYSGEGAHDEVGSSVTGGVDLDGDGLPELLVGAAGLDAGGYRAGGVFVVSHDD